MSTRLSCPQSEVFRRTRASALPGIAILLAAAATACQQSGTLQVGNPPKPQAQNSAERAFEESRIQPETAPAPAPIEAASERTPLPPTGPAQEAAPAHRAPRGTPLDSGTVMYTNDDLAGLPGGAPAGKGSGAATQAETLALGDDYLQGVSERATARMASETAAAKEGARVQALQNEFDELTRREASLHNPLLPRAPETGAEKSAGTGADANSRLDAIAKRKAELEKEIKNGSGGGGS